MTENVHRFYDLANGAAAWALNPPASTSERMDQEGATKLDNEARRLNDILTWAVYNSPSDLPGKIVARPHSMRFNGPLLCHIQADDLDSLREMLPRGLYRIDRAPTDDAVILETWV
jgi:hypothetical protein